MEILLLLVSGKPYHIYNRGNNRENIFIEKRNYQYFLTLYEKHIAPIADTFASCLIRNHFHLVVRIKDKPALAPARQDLQDLRDLEGFDPTNQFYKLFNATQRRSIRQPLQEALSEERDNRRGTLLPTRSECPFQSTETRVCLRLSRIPPPVLSTTPFV